MLTLAVSSYDISLSIHITAVVIGFGATFAESIAFPVALKAGTRHLPYLHQLQLAINRFFAAPALLIVIATGFYQVAVRDFEFGDFWLWGTFAIAIALGALNGAYFIPSDRKLGPMIEREIEAGGGGDVVPSDEYAQLAKRQGILGAVAGVLVVVAIFLMVIKPGL